jgi:hypothetical protein
MKDKKRVVIAPMVQEEADETADLGEVKFARLPIQRASSKEGNWLALGWFQVEQLELRFAASIEVVELILPYHRVGGVLLRLPHGRSLTKTSSLPLTPVKFGGNSLREMPTEKATNLLDGTPIWTVY